MGRMKTSLIVIALALLASLVVFGLRPDEPNSPSVSDTPHGLSFEVHVVKPLTARPLFGLLPDGIFGLPPSELRLDHESRGAEIVGVEHNRLELRADGWDLLIEIDDRGKIAPATRIAFPIELADRLVTLRCRPADRASGHLTSTTGEGSDELDGSFLVEFATCENALSGKAVNWPPAPLTVRGSFAGLSRDRRELTSGH